MLQRSSSKEETRGLPGRTARQRGRAELCPRTSLGGGAGGRGHWGRCKVKRAPWISSLPARLLALPLPRHTASPDEGPQESPRNACLSTLAPSSMPSPPWPQSTCPAPSPQGASPLAGESRCMQRGPNPDRVTGAMMGQSRTGPCSPHLPQVGLEETRRPLS